MSVFLDLVAVFILILSTALLAGAADPDFGGLVTIAAFMVFIVWRILA